ncbi:DUF3850 domain-containing protein [Lactococcus kimchii]|uniref:DUF3850 domain-containing protein n=1 Tax=Lactococcus sp. S-13 TaxID=2507158 RepID=UPI001023231E|nr:DUF3850 domain-containing protein [Lactococcus sp. S-13]RZI48444.1 DUF3850 domain-containing protein [Lactococcus sp. S-13]
MKTHELKLDIKYFDDVESGKKNFEIRKNDRDFQVGDILELKKISWLEKLLVPIRFAISIMTNKRQTYLDKDDSPCVKSKADTIKVKINYVLSADEINEGIDFMSGDDTAHTVINGQVLILSEIEEVLKDYFHTDHLPDGYMVLGIEVIK